MPNKTVIMKDRTQLQRYRAGFLTVTLTQKLGLFPSFECIVLIMTHYMENNAN